MTNKTLQYLIDTDDFKDFRVGKNYSRSMQGKLGILIFATCKINNSTICFNGEMSENDAKQHINNYYKSYKLEKCL